MSSGSAQEKALSINLDGAKYGAIAEIGAGQEVARWFFHVGKASATVARSISAYDMAISNSLYGPTEALCQPRTAGIDAEHRIQSTDGATRRRSG